MKPNLNHLIVWATDRRAAAEFFADVAGLGPPTEFGHFSQVETGNGVTLDFADAHGDVRGLGLHRIHRDDLAGAVDGGAGHG